LKSGASADAAGEGFDTDDQNVDWLFARFAMKPELEAIREQRLQFWPHQIPYPRHRKKRFRYVV